MKKNKFIYNSILLIFVNFIIRFISFSYDTLLYKKIGAESIGLYHMVMPLLMICLMFTTAGVPTSVSKLVAEYNSSNNYPMVRRVLRVALFFVLLFSVLLSIILILLAKFISLNILKNKDSLYCLYLLTPAIIIISITSTIRSYYYGLNMVTIASASEIIEHVTRFIFVLGFLYLTTSDINPLYGATIGILGITLGEAFDLLWLFFLPKPCYNKKSYNIHRVIPISSTLIKIISMACPLTISGLFNVILQFINTILIPQRLIASGYSNNEALAAFGRIMGMAIPLIYLPYIVTSALVLNIIPNLSAEMALKNYKNVRSNITLAIKATLLISIPTTCIYLIFPQPLSLFIYDDPLASKFIQLMGYSTIFLSLQHILSGILNGLNKQTSATIHRIIGMFIQLAITYILVGNSSFHINGYFIAFFISASIICLLDIALLSEKIKFNIVYSDLLFKPLLATIAMLFSIYIVQKSLISLHMSYITIWIISLVLSIVSYISTIGLLKYLDEDIFPMKK